MESANRNKELVSFVSSCLRSSNSFIFICFFFHTYQRNCKWRSSYL